MCALEKTNTGDFYIMTAMTIFGLTFYNKLTTQTNFKGKDKKRRDRKRETRKLAYFIKVAS